MVDVLLDPAVLAAPFYLESDDQVGLALETVAEWHAACWEAPWLRVLLPDNLDDLLMASDAFPLYDAVRNVLVGHNITYYFTNDVTRILQSLLERGQRLGEVSQLTALYTDACCTPQPGSDGRCEALRAALLDAIVLLACWLEAAGRSCDLARLVTCEAAGPAGLVSVAATVEAAECGTGSIPECPWHVSVAVQTCHRVGGLLESLDYAAVWAAAAGPCDLKMAVEGAARAIISTHANTSDASPQRFVIGTEFAGSLSRWQANGHQPYAATTLETCARLIAGLPKADVVPFKDGTGRRSLQRQRRDGSLAFRTHISSGNPALRLLLWRLPSGVWELANVGAKKELMIETGDPDRAV